MDILSAWSMKMLPRARIAQLIVPRRYFRLPQIFQSIIFTPDSFDEGWNNCRTRARLGICGPRSTAETLNLSRNYNTIQSNMYQALCDYAITEIFILLEQAVVHRSDGGWKRRWFCFFTHLLVWVKMTHAVTEGLTMIVLSWLWKVGFLWCWIHELLQYRFIVEEKCSSVKFL